MLAALRRDRTNGGSSGRDFASVRQSYSDGIELGVAFTLPLGPIIDSRENKVPFRMLFVISGMCRIKERAEHFPVNLIVEFGIRCGAFSIGVPIH